MIITESTQTTLSAIQDLAAFPEHLVEDIRSGFRRSLLLDAFFGIVWTCFLIKTVRDIILEVRVLGKHKHDANVPPV